MAEVFHRNDSNSPVTYAFRFASSDQLIYLTQQQIDLIPYLSVLIAHQNDFLSSQNETGEYVLNEPIGYSSFMSILRSISSQNPYKLLDELPEGENVFETLEMFDYLGLPSFPLPLLRYANLVQSNPDKSEHEKQRIEYERANLREVRQIAAKFAIALAKDEYQLCDSTTKKTIFNLINVILSNSAVFNLRFRCHTLTIAKNRCYSFFSKEQKRQLQGTHRIAQHGRSSPSTYLSDDNKSLPNNFDNPFIWKGVSRSIDENQPDFISIRSIRRINRMALDRIDYSLINSAIVPFSGLRFLDLFTIFNTRELWNDELEHNRRTEEAQSTRLKHYNILPTRLKVDKFKHRCGPKAQKYR